MVRSSSTASGRAWLPGAPHVVSHPAASTALDGGGIDLLAAHLAAARSALECLEVERWRIWRWGEELAARLLAGHRLLVAGNGGSAAHAAHLTSELVGRYSRDRRPFAAIALAAEPSALTAIGNDWSFDEVFARQVEAFGRPGDVLVAISTSGRSRNVLAAVERARSLGITAWALTGVGPNPLLESCQDGVPVAARTTATVQEMHQIAVHMLCEAVDSHVLDRPRPRTRPGREVGL